MPIKLITNETITVTVGVQINPLVLFSLIKPIQIGGFIPFTDCDTDECRNISTCYINPVFGSKNNAIASYENDLQPFLFRDTFYNSNKDNSAFSFNYQLQKLVENKWVNIGAPNSGALGANYPFASINRHEDYRGYSLNWGSVLLYHGAGCYRMKIIRSYILSSATTKRTTIFKRPGITSEPFNIGALSVLLHNGQVLIITLPAGLTATVLKLLLNNSQEAKENNLMFDVYFSGGELHISATGTSANYVQTIALMPNDDPSNIFQYVSSTTESATQEIITCAVSEPFKLLEFNCNRADSTVKFENWRTGEIADIDKPYLLHDYCGFTWYDSIRVYGGFYGEGIKEFSEKAVEWGKPKHGYINVVNDEAIHGYFFESNLLPDYLHKRLPVYGFMGCELAVSDYNLNNPDYGIKRLLVKKDGNYPLTPYLQGLERKSSAKVQFVRLIQGVIKSNCCANDV